jgi:hypothetical protein
MGLSCPKCASIQVQQLSVVYESDNGARSRLAAPPVRKRWLAWAMVATVCGLPVVASVRQPGPGTVVLTAMAALAAAFAFNAWSYNARVHPALLERWQHSVMCHRCGNVFTAT